MIPAERTVGAALRGRPWFETGSRNPRRSILEYVVKPRAATEGRPYSTFCSARSTFGTELHQVRVTVWIYPSRVSPTGVFYAPTLRRNCVESLF